MRLKVTIFKLQSSIAGLIVLVFIIINSCQPAQEKYYFDVQLNSGWKFRKSGEGKWLPAYVPGNVISDLFINKKIADPFIRANADSMQWIAKAGWEYQNMFVVEPEILLYDSVYLFFQGLNANAAVYLNDSLILKADNVLRSWKVECKTILKETDNHLKVIFHPLDKKIEKQKQLPASVKHEANVASQNPDGNPFSKDLICFGMPFYTGGICRPVHIQAWSIAVIGDLYFYPKQITKKNAAYNVDYVISSSQNQNVNIELLIENKLVKPPETIKLIKGQNNRKAVFNIENPKLWWTNGLGKPHLYNFTLRVKKEQNIINERNFRLGVRTIELAQKSGSFGNEMYFKLNGVPVFIKGVNYFPHEVLPASGNDENYKNLIENARLSNINTIWMSGGIHEDDAFYDFCDEKGIMVCKDLTLINTRPAIDSTNFELSSTHENKSGKYVVFESETPSLPSIHTLETFALPENMALVLTSENIKSQLSNCVPAKHAKDITETIIENITENYKIPKDVTSFIYLSQLVQADNIKNAIEQNRRNWPNCSGWLYSRFNDGIPSISGSTIDYFGRWKLAQYTIKNSFTHFLVIPVRENNYVKIYGASDAFKDMEAILLAKLIDFKGNVLYVKQIPVSLKAVSSNLLLSVKEPEMLHNAVKAKCCLVVQLNQATSTLSQNILYFTEPKNIILSKAKLTVDVNETGKGFSIILRSDQLMKNVFLETNTKDSYFSDNNFDLLPEKRTRITVQYSGTKTELLSDLHIRSLVDVN